MLRYAGVDVHAAGDADLYESVLRHGIDCPKALDRDATLDLLMGFVVGPRLGLERPCFICDYPVSQAALARLKPGPPPVAARFELYLDGIELANGFHELADGGEQRARFTRDLRLRHARGAAAPPLDEHLLEAMVAGMPDCAEWPWGSIGWLRWHWSAAPRRCHGIHHRQCLMMASSYAREVLARSGIDAQISPSLMNSGTRTMAPFPASQAWSLRSRYRAHPGSVSTTFSSM